MSSKKVVSITSLLVAGSLAAVAALVMAGRSAGAAAATAAAAQAPVEQNVGGGAPTRVLVENDSLRVTLVSYPAHFRREGGKRRRLEQLIVYIDEGAFKIERPPGERRPAGPRRAGPGPESPVGLDGKVSRNPHALGTVAWHPKDSLTPTLVTSKAYRALYIELKR